MTPLTVATVLELARVRPAWMLPVPPAPMPIGRMVAAARNQGREIDEVRGPDTSRKLTVARHAVFVAMSDAGWRQVDIARWSGRHLGTISGHMWRARGLAC